VAQLNEQLEYRRFRKLVINLVLSTDLASPERTQIGKSKWKEAFGDPYETLERKLREVAAASENNMNGNHAGRQRRTSLSHNRVYIAGRRGSAISAMSASPSSRPPSRHDDDDNVEEEDDDSLSATPDASEASENEDDHNHNMTVAPKFLTDVASAVAAAETNALRDKFERRMSASSVQSSKYRQRLGILRTVDLSGETIETYSRRGSMATAKSNQSNTDAASVVSTNYQSMIIADEPDELKATVVMETLITAADVAHNLQSWNHMVRL
jgi:hypothetical protein